MDFLPTALLHTLSSNFESDSAVNINIKCFLCQKRLKEPDGACVKISCEMIFSIWSSSGRRLVCTFLLNLFLFMNYFSEK